MTPQAYLLYSIHAGIFSHLQMKSESLGEVLLQEQFTAHKERQGETSVPFQNECPFSKEIKDSTGKSKYQYKFKMMVSPVQKQKGVQLLGCFLVYAPISEGVPLLKYRCT